MAVKDNFMLLESRRRCLKAAKAEGIPKVNFINVLRSQQGKHPHMAARSQGGWRHLSVHKRMSGADCGTHQGFCISYVYLW